MEWSSWGFKNQTQGKNSGRMSRTFPNLRQVELQQIAV